MQWSTYLPLVPMLRKSNAKGTEKLLFSMQSLQLPLLFANMHHLSPILHNTLRCWQVKHGSQNFYVDTQLAFTTCLACTSPFFASCAGNSSSLLGWDQHDMFQAKNNLLSFSGWHAQVQVIERCRKDFNGVGIPLTITSGLMGAARCGRWKCEACGQWKWMSPRIYNVRIASYLIRP